MRLIKYSDYPTVGRWLLLSDKETKAAMAAMTPVQKANIDHGGWARVRYRVGNKRWNALLKKTSEDVCGLKR